MKVRILANHLYTFRNQQWTGFQIRRNIVKISYLLSRSIIPKGARTAFYSRTARLQRNHPSYSRAHVQKESCQNISFLLMCCVWKLEIQFRRTPNKKYSASGEYRSNVHRIKLYLRIESPSKISSSSLHYYYLSQ